MTSWLETLSIRTRCFLLVLVIVLPVLAIVFWLLASQVNQARDAANEKVRILATDTAANLQREIDRSEAILRRLALWPQVKALDPNKCDPIVAEFVPLHPEYLNVDVRDAHGNIVCSHLQRSASSLSTEESRWFKHALQSGRFMASNVAVGSHTGLKLVAFSYPIRGDDGTRIGLLDVTVNLLALNKQLLASTPTNAVVTVADATRAVLLRSAEAENYIGTRPPAGDPDPAMGRRDGYLTTTGRDGVPRLFAFLPLPDLEWRVSASLPRAEVFAGYQAMVDRAIVIGVAVLLLALALAWRLSAAIVGPITSLKRTAARVAAGDQMVRAQIDGPPDIGALARQFNEMLDAKALSESRLRGIFESAADAIITANASQVIVKANPAAVKMFRCSLAELIGTPLERFIPQRLHEAHGKSVQAFGDGAIVARNMGVGREVMAVRADGEEFPVEASISHMSVDGQKLYTAMLRDVTESRRARNELLASKSNLAAALSSMSDAVFISDVEGRFLEFNDAFATFHRFKNKGDCRTTLAEYPELLEVFLANGEPAALNQWAVPRALRGEAGTGVEYKFRRKDTGETWVGSCSFAPIRAKDGMIVGSVVTARDVTQAKQAQADLASANAELQSLVAALDKVQEDERKRIAREMHDELLQKLAAIRLDIGAISHRSIADPANVARVAADIDDLASQVIDATRRIVNDLRPQMLEDLGLGPALEMLASKFSKRAGISCDLQGADEVSGELLESPSVTTCLYRFVQEALHNVSKHAHATTVQVRLSSVEDGHVMLSIRDDGVGMNPSDRRKPGSFGMLGMRERARAVGGVMRIESRPGTGTTIEVVVPVGSNT